MVATPTAPIQSEPAATAKKSRKNPARRRAQRTQSTLDEPKVIHPVAGKQTTSTSQGQHAPTRAQSSPSVLTLQQARRSPASQCKASSPQAKPQPSAKPNNASLPRTVSLPSSCTTGPPSSLTHTAPAMLSGGLLGCLAGAAMLPAISAWQEVSGPSAAITTIRAARLSIDNLSEELIASLQTGTYSTDEALDMLRRAALAYACVIPGGAALVDRVFKEVELVRHARGAEVERLAGTAWKELQTVNRRGGNGEEVRGVVLKHLGRLSVFASRVSRDVVARNPALDAKIVAPKRPGMPRAKVPSATVNLTVKHKGST